MNIRRRQMRLVAPQHLPEVTWYVAFADYLTAARGPWWHRWSTSPGFRHCLAVQPCEFGTLTVNPLMTSGINVRWEPVEVQECLTLMCSAGWTVLKLNAIRRAPVAGPFVGPLTCVSVIKSLLGLRGWAITPKQLYQSMRKAGAEEVKHE